MSDWFESEEILKMEINMINKKGFTIIELIMAAALLSIGFLAVISLSVVSFTRTMTLSSTLTANYLTQEGFEVVRRIRDENFNVKFSEEIAGGFEGEGRYWLEGLMEESQNTVVGSIDYTSTELGSRQNDPLLLDSNGLFNYSTGDSSGFYREITLEKDTYDFGEGYPDDAEYVLVTVKITWEDRGRVRDYVAKTKLFNWY